MTVSERINNEDSGYGSDHEAKIESVNVIPNDTIIQGVGSSNVHVIEDITRSESLTSSHIERVGRKRKNYNRSDEQPKLIIRPERTLIFENPNTELRPKNHLNGVERLRPSSYQRKKPNRCR